MKKIVLSVITVFSLLAPALIFPKPATAAACPDEEPETLLSLYRNSDAIYIGSYGGSQESEPVRIDEKYSQTEIKKYFDISTTLKGSPLKKFTLLDEETRYDEPAGPVETPDSNQTEQVVPEMVDEETEYEASRKLTPGDKVVLFLTENEEGGLDLTDYDSGIKNLPAADIAVYEARIKELVPILAAKKPSAEKLTDWLVRCAEDAATRWEGAYELERSFNTLDYKNQRAAEQKKRIANGAKIEDDEADSGEDLETDQSAVFAETLNAHQKQTLANILLNSDFQTAPKKEGTAGFVRGDRELMTLVSRWADSRVAELLVNRIRGGGFTAEENSEMMDTVASILKDERLTAVAGRFSDVYYEEDDREVEEGDLEADEPDVDAQKTVAPGDDGPVVRVGDVVDAQTGTQTDEEKSIERPAMNYRQLREQIVSKFLMRADEVMANPNASVAQKR